MQIEICISAEAILKISLQVSLAVTNFPRFIKIAGDNVERIVPQRFCYMPQALMYYIILMPHT